MSNLPLKERFISLIYVIAIALVPVIVSSCHTQRQSTDSTYNTDTWERLSMPMKVKIEGEEKFSIGGTAIFDNSKSITLSFNKIGMEIGLLKLTADSVFFVGRIDKNYTMGSVGEIFNDSVLNISEIQSALLGFEPANPRGFSLEYSGDFRTRFGKIVKKVIAKGESESGPIELTLEWNPKKAKWNEKAATRKIKIGKNYTAFPLSNLKQIIMLNWEGGE